MIRSFLFEISRPTVMVYYIAATLIFGVAGPFGTFEAGNLPSRMAFWAVVSGVAILMGVVSRVIFLRVFPAKSLWLRETFCISSFTIGFAPIFWLSIQQVAETGGTAPLPFWGAFAFVAMVGILSVALEFVVIGPKVSEQSAPEPGPDQPPLLDRVDPEKRSPILSLRARDHYVDVTTHLGQDPVLIRMADAIELLGGTDGARVHRSHWVARAAVTGSQHRQGRLFLTLQNGEEVPVSRKYRERVEQSLLA